LVSSGTPKGKLVIDGLPGDPKMTVRNYSWGIHNGSTAGGAGGAGSGKSTFDVFTIEKLVDENSVALAKAVANGEHFQSATIKFFEPGTSTPKSIFTIPDPTIAAVVHSYKNDNVESVSFNYAQIQWVYKTSSGDQTFCWNVAGNAAC
jgi:type VI secretion system Hcp family effector